MRAGISTRKQRKDRVLFDTLDLMRCTVDSNTQVSPAKKDIIWVKHARTGCRYRHPKHIHHITDTALLGLVNDAIKPLDISIDKMRKIKRRMGYIRRAGFRACLCVVCLVIKLLLAACHKKGNQEQIIKHVHCCEVHANCRCKRPAATCATVLGSVDHPVANATVANATAGATKVTHPPVSAKTNSGITSTSESDSDFEPDSDCNSEYDSAYDSEWEAQQKQAVDREAGPSATMK
jgi:hypothetical protein